MIIKKNLKMNLTISVNNFFKIIIKLINFIPYTTIFTPFSYFQS
jgi:hypothetical protein